MIGLYPRELHTGIRSRQAQFLEHVMKRIRSVFTTPSGNLIFGSAVILLYLAVSAVFCAFDLHVTGLTAPCRFYAATHFLCPGCGGTRCIDSLLHFRPFSAFVFNPMAVLVFAAVMALAVRCVINALRRPYKAISYNFRAWHVLLFAGLYLFFFLIRNFFRFNING